MAGSLMERIALGPVITDGAYFLELERRCLGSYATGVPDAVLRNPGGVLELHREYASAGSEVILAMGWGVQSTEVDREREHHRVAVELAREAAGPDRLVAGNISASGVSRGVHNEWVPLTDSERLEAQRFFERRVDQQMAVGVDAFFLESYTSAETASLAIPFIRDAGVPAVVMLVYHDSEYTVEGYSPAEGAKFLEDQGADVVGVNCMRSWPTMRRIIRDIRKAVSIPVISQPVGYEMEPGEVYCHAIHGPQPTYPKVEPRSATRFAMAEYAREANAVGVNVVGGCCGTLPYHIRAMAETLGKTVALPDMDRGHGAPAAL